MIITFDDVYKLFYKLQFHQEITLHKLNHNNRRNSKDNNAQSQHKFYPGKPRLGRNPMGPSLDNIVAAARPSKIFAYTQILEPTVDPLISHSLVTYCLGDDFKIPSWISSVVHSFIFI